MKKHSKTGYRQIRYQSRKAYADRCPRIKGRFARLDQVEALLNANQNN